MFGTEWKIKYDKLDKEYLWYAKGMKVKCDTLEEELASLRASLAALSRGDQVLLVVKP